MSGRYLVDLTGKKILIIGASQGIGAQTAVTLSRLGAQLILSARNEEKLKNILGSLEGKDHCYYCMDVSQHEKIEASIKEIVEMVGSLDGMVYCAGITDDRPLAMDKPPVVDRVLKTNLEGFIEVVRCVTKKNNYNIGMRLIGISSTAAFVGTKAHVIYAASKAGMEGAVRSMAVELSEKGICINTIVPAFIKTEMFEKTLNDIWGGEVGGRLKRQYLGLGQPEDVANAVAFLISPVARFITGNCLPVDGGTLAN